MKRIIAAIINYTANYAMNLKLLQSVTTNLEQNIKTSQMSDASYKDHYLCYNLIDIRDFFYIAFSAVSFTDLESLKK